MLGDPRFGGTAWEAVDRAISECAYELSTGKHAPTLGDLHERFGIELKQPDSGTASGCKYEIMLSNRALAGLHLSPYTALSSSFWVRDDLVQENVLQLWDRERQRPHDRGLC
jgi:hypothetical protein